MKKLLVIALLVAACGGATDSAPPGSQAAFAADTAPPTALPVAVAPTPTPSATPSPTSTPTPDPEAVRKTAADAYLAAAETSNKAFKTLDKKYKTFGTLSRARAYYKASAKIDLAFINKMKGITFPDDTKGDVHSMVAKWLEVQSLETEGSGVKSWTAVLSVQKALTTASRKASAASNLVRSDLGLPPTHL
jgi:hypothetical protein